MLATLTVYLFVLVALSVIVYLRSAPFGKSVNFTEANLGIGVVRDAGRHAHDLVFARVVGVPEDDHNLVAVLLLG